MYFFLLGTSIMYVLVVGLDNPLLNYHSSEQSRTISLAMSTKGVNQICPAYQILHGLDYSSPEEENVMAALTPWCWPHWHSSSGCCGWFTLSQFTLSPGHEPHWGYNSLQAWWSVVVLTPEASWAALLSGPASRGLMPPQNCILSGNCDPTFWRQGKQNQY